MSAPKRVQMTRNKPWRAEHPDAVIVDRRTRWGNPITLDSMREHYPDHGENSIRHMVVSDFRGLAEGRFDEWPEGATYPSMDEIRSELRGKDLACWCPLEDQHGKPVPCHADVLLELANSPKEADGEGARRTEGEAAR